MATVVEFLLSGFTDNSGEPLAGGLVYTYSAGTTTDKATYTNVLATIPETNPIVLDANGRKQVFASGSYKFVVKTSAGVTLYIFDNVVFGEDVTTYDEMVALNTAGTGIVVRQAITLTGNLTLTVPLRIEKGGSIITNGFTLTINGAFTAGAYQVFTAASGEVVFGSRYATEQILTEWWGALANNSTDCTTPIVKAIASIAVGGVIQFLAGSYRHTGFNVPGKIALRGLNAKTSNLVFTPTSGNAITLTDGSGNTSYNQITKLGIRAATTSSGKAITSPLDLYVADVVIEDYEIEGFLVGIYIPYGLQVHVGFGRGLGQGSGVANGIGVQLGDRTHSTPRVVNTAIVEQAYMNGYATSFVADCSICQFTQVTAESCVRAFLIAARTAITGSWIQATTTFVETRSPGGYPIIVTQSYFLNGLSVEVDDVTSMCTLNGVEADLQIYSKSGPKGPGRYQHRFAVSRARGVQFGEAGASEVVLYNLSGSLTADSDICPLAADRFQDVGTTWPVLALKLKASAKGYLGVTAAGDPCLIGSGGSNEALHWDNARNLAAGAGSLGTTSTDGFLYVPTCAGTPTGVPSGESGFAPIVIDITNHKLYFYSGGSWRDAGP